MLESLYQCQDAPRSAAVLSGKSVNGATPAHVAAQFGCLEAIDFMHRHGVNLNVKVHMRISLCCYRHLQLHLGGC